MNGIFYFSSTGNSLYIAKRIKEQLDGEIIYIPKYQGDGSEFDKIIIVSPIYSYGLPVHTYDFLLNVNNDTPVYIVLNYGGITGGADYFAYNLAKENGKNILGVYTMKMPENFTLTFTVPSFYCNSTLKKAPKAVDKIIAKIANEEISAPKKTKTQEEKYYTNKSNWHHLADDFSANENCVKCGKCVDVCPAQNISIEDGVVKFADKCIACLGCYHRCPQKAIIYKGRNKKDRYFNPNVDENELGK